MKTPHLATHIRKVDTLTNWLNNTSGVPRVVITSTNIIYNTCTLSKRSTANNYVEPTYH